ncbi:disease resistance protein RGA2-like [Cajanus cajan]|uniref:disease resistance protein RGA2-like n=1 Tax=Cajanus cajan TaxID=3821 RepID=UPI00098DB800|nr:disease resistance protein RGA2-like [Cajanus cajan]
MEVMLESMGAFAKEAIDRSLTEMRTIFKKKASDDSQIEILDKIADEINNSDVKAQVILKQKLDNMVMDMENLDTETSNYASKSKLPFFSRIGSSKKRLNVAQRDEKVMENLERVADKVKYLNVERKEAVGESGEDLELVGREKEKEEIIDQLMLLSRSRNNNGASCVPVIAISGLGGIGKTKLARYVCQEQHLGLPAWVIGTEYNTLFDAGSIARLVIRSVVPATATIPSPTTKTLNILVVLDDWRVEIDDKDVKELQEKVKEHWKVELKGIDQKALQKELKEDKRVEIGDQDLKALLDKLKEVRPRVRAIMITTRSCFVAMARNIAASPVKSYALPGLDEKESVSLFRKSVSRFEKNHGLGDDDSSITKVVAQCRGVPLAIITMAKWFDSFRSQLTGLTEELIYSYYDQGLPHSCFAYCSLFPQGYLFDTERLIHLWMAEGFLKLQPSDPSTSFESDPEEIGRKCLRDLVGRSIFQDVKVDEFGQVISCRMHPLMHDMARFVAGRENITVDPKGHKVHRKVLRASFDLSLDFSRGIPPPLFDKAKSLRSIFFFANTQSRLPMQLDLSTLVLENIFKSFKRLCVLDLRDLGIVALPSSIGDLKDLQYLDLSQNNMEKLPSSIVKLSNLETLKLSRCYSLKELPKDFKNLIQLKHLDMEGCLGLTCMPPKMSKLQKLETLSTFVIGKNDHTASLEELERLNELRGQLEIFYMSYESEETRYWGPKPEEIGLGRRCLRDKTHLQRLKLKWDLGVNRGNGFRHLLVMDSLEPHSSLKVLLLVGYQGLELSSWLTSTSIRFECLVKLSLQDCHGCKYISQEDALPKQLKTLELIRLDSLECVAQNCDKDAAFYKTLMELTVSDCPKLKSWWQEEKDVSDRPFFAKISKLHVHHCPLLTCMPLYFHLDKKSSLKVSFGSGIELVLVGSSFKLLLDTMSMVGSSSTVNYSIPLENLHIQNCNHLENLSNAFQHLSSLQRLTIENCATINLDDLGKWEGLESLRFLTIRKIPVFSSFSFGHNVTTLRELTLHNCHGLTSISNTIGKLTLLRRLLISKCNNLKSLPIAMKELKSLKTLLILDCVLLLPRCQPETGHDWPQISHIKHIQVK